MKGTDELQLHRYLTKWMRPLRKRLYPWFGGTVASVIGTTYPLQVSVIRTGEGTADGNTYVVASPSYRPQVGDRVDLIWRDDDVGYAVVPLAGPSGTAPWGGWLHWSRYIVGPGGSIDTSSNPGGNIPLPAGFSHAKVIWKAIDTSANTTAAFGGLQLGIAGGAIDTGAHYNWTDISNANGGAPVGSGGTSAADWAAFVATGGGTGSQWMSYGEITIPNYADSSQAAKAFWEILQVNAGTIFRRQGSGYYAGGTGPVTLLHFFAGTAKLAANTTFDLLVAA